MRYDFMQNMPILRYLLLELQPTAIHQKGLALNHHECSPASCHGSAQQLARMHCRPV